MRAVLQGKWEDLYHVIKGFREACGEKIHLKTILATGELVYFIMCIG
jgi:deoxyribose-phosphate aldolase